MLIDRDLHDLSPKTRLLVGLSLGFGVLSTVATGFAFFWFVRIKRSFRHDLIMLLVQGDFIKSAAFVVFPIVQLARGPISSNSPFCGFSGFVLSLGIEASDIAVLLIAIHSAMYIRHPRSGLYPYRWVAYAAYVVVPILLAALAFADNGYEDLGAYCYLYRERGWSRLALSWVPRYVLIAFLVVVYLWIYIYIRVRVNLYDRRGSTNQASTTASARSSTPWGRTDRIQRPLSTSSLSGQSTAPPRPSTMLTERPPIQWKIPFYSGTAVGLAEDVAVDQNADIAPGQNHTALLAIRRATRGSSATMVPDTSTSCSSGNDNSTSAPRMNSLAILQVAKTMPSRSGSSSAGGTFDTPPYAKLSLQQALAMTRHGTTQDSHVDLAPNTQFQPNDELDSEVARNRERIRRQLRSLIVYPLIYLLTWLFPLVNQAFGQAGHGKPVWILCMSIISFAIQGFANAVVFTVREKPWRHKEKKGFWNGMHGKVFGGSIAGQGKGRTRDEMMVASRDARARRAEEAIDEALGSSGHTAKHGQPVSGTRHWWDTTEFDTDLMAAEEKPRPPENQAATE